MRSNKADVKL